MAKPLSPARKDGVWRRISNTVDQEELTAALMHSGDTRAERLLEMCLDPAFKDFSLARLAQRANMTAADLVDAVRRYYVDIGIVTASRHLPRIMEDAAIDAVSNMQFCVRCDGTGEVEDKRNPEVSQICPACQGEGHVRVAGNAQARRAIFDAVGVTGKTPLLAQQIFNATTFDPVSMIKALEKITDLSGDKRSSSD